MSANPAASEGILLIDKEAGCTSFQIVEQLRRKTGIEKIGHAGTLDPFATGVMVMLVGKNYTKRSNEFLNCDKAYRASVYLGKATDTHDLEGLATHTSDKIPTLAEIETALAQFQGEILQTPPMFSAKKIKGQKLCDLARKGISIEREPVKVRLNIQMVSYNYPLLDIEVSCSKGAYIRSLAHDLGLALGCYAHLSELARIRSGAFHLGQCIPQASLKDTAFSIEPYLKK
jgi:tRNA pseudouridine55 synthase